MYRYEAGGEAEAEREGVAPEAKRRAGYRGPGEGECEWRHFESGVGSLLLWLCLVVGRAMTTAGFN